MLQKLWRIGQPGINQVTINGCIYYLYQLFRLEKIKVLHHQQIAAETPEERAVRLERKRDHQRQKLDSDTPEERALRLQHLRDLQQQRLATESPEERILRLQHMRYLQQQRLATDSPEEKALRIQHMKKLQQQRLATESPEERALRIEHMRNIQQQRLATESPEERSKRLQQYREARQSAGQEHKNDLPLQEVQREMAKFHQAMSTIQSPACSTCLEQFPGMKLSSKSAECARCARDKLTPKLYSAANNMSPGKNVPEELQVSYL